MERLKKNNRGGHVGARGAPSDSPCSWRERPTLRITEVAELIGVSTDLVQTMIDAEDLTVRRVGRIPLIVTASLIDWADGNPRPPSSSQRSLPSVTTKHQAEAARLITKVQKNPQTKKEK